MVIGIAIGFVSLIFFSEGGPPGAPGPTPPQIVFGLWLFYFGQGFFILALDLFFLGLDLFILALDLFILGLDLFIFSKDF